jgi:hypothetical protein
MSHPPSMFTLIASSISKWEDSTPPTGRCGGLSFTTYDLLWMLSGTTGRRTKDADEKEMVR